MDLVSFKDGQVTKTLPELALTCPNFHTTPMGGHLGFDIYNVHQPLLHAGSSAVRRSIVLVLQQYFVELMTCQFRVGDLDH
ncbi:hypothetical protein TNCV_1514161 [Trichonephila clavipes]|nr:hypothetical protein TNCV_1514161 [Trichonephila clavipes]